MTAVIAVLGFFVLVLILAALRVSNDSWDDWS